MLRWKGIGLAWVLCTAVGACLASGLQLPITVERVWYREADRPFFRGYKADGDLVVREDRLEFVHPKEGWSLPLGEIDLVSLGTMKGDVDTEWVVLSLADGEGKRVGLRDGHKMGYGAETRKIYELLLEVARQKKVAQFGAPAGMVPYEPLQRMIAFAVPEGWNPVQLSKEIHGEFILPLGRTGFAPEEISSPEAWSRAVPRLAVERTDVRKYKRAACRSGLPGRLLDRIREEIGEKLYRLESRPARLGPCKGVRIRGEGSAPETVGESIDLVAVVGKGVLYRISLVSRAPEPGREPWSLLDQVLGTVRLADPF